MSSILGARAEQVSVVAHKGVKLVWQASDRNIRLSAARLHRRLECACGYGGLCLLGAAADARA